MSAELMDNRVVGRLGELLVEKRRLERRAGIQCDLLPDRCWPRTQIFRPSRGAAGARSASSTRPLQLLPQQALDHPVQKLVRLD